MIGLILIGHGDVPKAYLEALEEFVGHQQAAAYVLVPSDGDMDAVRTELLKTIAEVDQGSGVIICADVLGGTPSNLAISCMGSGRVEVITGVNLPLLIKLAGLRSAPDSLASIAEQAIEAGRKYINAARLVLSGANVSPRPERLQEAPALHLLTLSLIDQVDNELARLSRNIPNEPVQLATHRDRVKFLENLLNGLVTLSGHLESLLAGNTNLDHIQKAVDALGEVKSELQKWWDDNKATAVDWCVRFPAIGGVIGMLRFAGADPTMASAVAIAGIGGPKLVSAVKDFVNKK
jgi:PTS system mannose-specific IIA component